MSLLIIALLIAGGYFFFNHIQKNPTWLIPGVASADIKNKVENVTREDLLQNRFEIPQFTGDNNLTKSTGLYLGSNGKYYANELEAKLNGA